MTDKFKDQDSMLPSATDDKKKISAKPAKSTQVIINPPEKVDGKRGFQERFQRALEKHTVILEKKTELVLQSKATRSDFPQEVIEQVYKRGFKALPLNTELTREQYAMNRVNSFIAGGAAMVEDCDLLPITERVHTRIGMKGTGGGARPHIKREKSPYNNRMVYHVVDAKGIVKHSTGDEFEAKKHLASKYNTYMGESTISPMKRFEGTKSLVKTYKDDTPGEGKKDVAEVFADQGSGSTARDNAEYMKRRKTAGIPHSNSFGIKSRGINLGSASAKKDTHVKTFHSSKEDEAKEFAKKNKHVVKKITYTDPYSKKEQHEFQVHKESTICSNCQADPCICDDSHGFVGEARMSASERFSRAFDKQRAKSDASLRRTPSSIPKKEEPKQNVAEAQLDELSKEKLQWYLRKSAKHLDKKGENMIKRDKKFKPGMNPLSRVIGGAMRRTLSIVQAAKKIQSKEEPKQGVK